MLVVHLFAKTQVATKRWKPIETGHQSKRRTTKSGTYRKNYSLYATVQNSSRPIMRPYLD